MAKTSKSQDDKKAQKSPVISSTNAVEATTAATVPPSTLLSTTPSEEIVLTDAEGRRYCRVSDCDQISNVDGYCRYHYLLFWKKIQVRKKILADGKLDRYIEELTARYTDKFIELLRKDLRSEKDFMAAVRELELDGGDDDNNDDDDAEDSKSYIDEVGGVPDTRDDDF